MSKINVLEASAWLATIFQYTGTGQAGYKWKQQEWDAAWKQLTCWSWSLQSALSTYKNIWKKRKNNKWIKASIVWLLFPIIMSIWNDTFGMTFSSQSASSSHVASAIIVNVMSIRPLGRIKSIIIVCFYSNCHYSLVEMRLTIMSLLLLNNLNNFGG